MSGVDDKPTVRTEEERRFYCPVEGCKGHAESWYMCFVPPLWKPGKVYSPGARVVFGQHVWVKRAESGLWDPA